MEEKKLKLEQTRVVKVTGNKINHILVSLLFLLQQVILNEPCDRYGIRLNATESISEW